MNVMEYCNKGIKENVAEINTPLNRNLLHRIKAL